MKKATALIAALLLALALVPTAALADGETVKISTSAQLMTAITNQLPGQTWILAAGTYDISRNTVLSIGGQTGWYFPIIANGITIKGAGIGKTTITSSVVSRNGDWNTQDFISIWGDNVTIKNLTIRPKLDTNKAIEVMGMNTTLQNIKILHNNIVTHASYASQLGIAEGAANDYWEGFTTAFAGSVYFYPQNAAKDIGNTVMDNVLITQAWISCRPSNVLLGTLTLKGCTTIDFRGSWYAGFPAYGVINSNPSVIIAEDFHVLYDETLETAEEQVLSLVPAGTKFFAPPCAPAEVYYQIDIVTGEGGASNPYSPVFTTSGGSSPTITFLPKAGYVIVDVKIDGVSIGAVASYTFTNVTANHKIEVIFALAGSATVPPQTGDHATYAGYAMLAVALAAALTVVLRRSRAR